MTKTRLRLKSEKPKTGDELLFEGVRRITGLIVSLIGLAIGIFGAVLLSQSFTLMTFFFHSLPLFAIGFALIIQGLATGRSLSWREAFELFMDTLHYI